MPAELKQQPIVMFCTGGIRCEKAGPYMEREGFEQVFQLDGGILKYFEECGGEHYAGECFVFDRRVGVDPSLAETENTLCFNCLAPLSLADQQDARYVDGQSCPHCYLTDAEQMARTIAERELAIARATTPLPGSEPYDNYRPLQHLGEARRPNAARHAVRRLSATCARVLARALRPAACFSMRPPAGDGRTASASRASGICIECPATSEPDVNAAIRVLHEDDAIVVINKPAPLPLHPSGRFNRNTLQWILNEVYHPQKLRPVHRLDANTTGIVVFARTRHFAGQLQPQFAAGNVEKLYLARIQGHPPETQFAVRRADRQRRHRTRRPGDRRARLGRSHRVSRAAPIRRWHVARRSPADHGAHQPNSRASLAPRLADRGRASVSAESATRRNANARDRATRRSACTRIAFRSITR